MAQPVQGNLDAFEKRLPKRGCAIQFLELTEQQRADFELALDSNHLSAHLIAQVMSDDPPKGWGFKNISNQIVQRHRNGNCSCKKPPGEKVQH